MPRTTRTAPPRPPKTVKRTTEAKNIKKAPNTAKKAMTRKR